MSGLLLYGGLALYVIGFALAAYNVGGPVIDLSGAKGEAPDTTYVQAGDILALLGASLVAVCGFSEQEGTPYYAIAGAMALTDLLRVGIL